MISVCRLPRALPLLALLVGASLAIGSNAVRLERTEQRTIHLEGARYVLVRVLNGAITVRGTEGSADDVAVTATITANANDDRRPQWENRQLAANCLTATRLVVERADSALVVTYDAGDVAGCSHSVALDVTVPRHLPVVAETENGEVDVLNITSVDVSCSNGNVELHGTSDTAARTENGDIDAERLSGTAMLTAVNGSIRADLSRNANEITLRTTNGDVELGLPAGIDARVDARVTTGTVSHTGLPARTVRQVRPGSLQALFGDGAGIVTVRVSAGTISLSGF